MGPVRRVVVSPSCILSRSLQRTEKRMKAVLRELHAKRIQREREDVLLLRSCYIVFMHDVIFQKLNWARWCASCGANATGMLEREADSKLLLFRSSVD